MTETDAAFHASLATVRAETGDVIDRLIEADRTAGALDDLATLVGTADRVFVFGAGRSGLALRMAAMRLMHLGLNVHVVGDVTTPAIGAGDVLLVASGSGTTAGVLRAAETAVKTGAAVGVLTTSAGSPLAELARVAVVVPAAEKLDRSGDASTQYAGGLFEQLVVLIGDALFDVLWRRSGQTADELWPRHTNIE